MIKPINLIVKIFFIIVAVSLFCITPKIIQNCFADDEWKETQDVTFKGDIQFSTPLNGTYSNGFLNYNEGQDDVKITTTGSLFDNNGNAIISFTDLSGILVHGKEYDYFQFDIDQWRVQIHSQMENFRENIIKKVFIRRNVE